MTRLRGSPICVAAPVAVGRDQKVDLPQAGCVESAYGRLDSQGCALPENASDESPLIVRQSIHPTFIDDRPPVNNFEIVSSSSDLPPADS
jgi:hypothetical protein